MSNKTLNTKILLMVDWSRNGKLNPVFSLTGELGENEFKPSDNIKDSWLDFKNNLDKNGFEYEVMEVINYNHIPALQ